MRIITSSEMSSIVIAVALEKPSFLILPAIVVVIAIVVVVVIVVETIEDESMQGKAIIR